jgi:hypothetical protein
VIALTVLTVLLAIVALAGLLLIAYAILDDSDALPPLVMIGLFLVLVPCVGLWGIGTHGTEACTLTPAAAVPAERPTP